MHYDKTFEQQVKAWAKVQNSEKRYAHVKGVVKSASKLAEQYAPEAVMVCRLAAWIHDAAKHYSDAELLQLAEQYQLPITPFERELPMLLHGAVAYALAVAQFGFEDEQIRSACTYHTCGAAGMNTVDKIVFLADKIEKGRDYPGVDVIRALAQYDLDAALLHFTADNLVYLVDKRRPIDPRMLELYNLLLQGRSANG